MTYKIQDFDDTEIGEIRLYIEKQVPYHILNNLYILSENIEDKSVTFVGVYRILKSCRNYASTKELKEKINYFIEKSKETYEKIYPLILEYTSSNIEYVKLNLLESMNKILVSDYEIIDELIDLFIVLGEQIQLMKTDATIGIETKKGDDWVERTVKEARKIAKEEGA